MNEAMAVVSQGLKAEKPTGDADHSVRLQYLKHARDINADRLTFLTKVDAVLNRTMAHEAEMQRAPRPLNGDPWMTPEAAAEEARRKAREAKPA